MIKYFSVSILFSLSVILTAAQKIKSAFPFTIRLEQMEIIFMPDTRMYMEGIADASSLQNDENPVGYIVGGINSSASNIFFDNTGKESKANGKIIQVYLRRMK